MLIVTAMVQIQHLTLDTNNFFEHTAGQMWNTSKIEIQHLQGERRRYTHGFVFGKRCMLLVCIKVHHHTVKMVFFSLFPPSKILAFESMKT